MGAASKGIIQRGHQHNATVYKSPYAKNPFDSVTDEELEDYKKVVERKAKGDCKTCFNQCIIESYHLLSSRRYGLQRIWRIVIGSNQQTIRQYAFEIPHFGY